MAESPASMPRAAVQRRRPQIHQAGYYPGLPAFLTSLRMFSPSPTISLALRSGYVSAHSLPGQFCLSSVSILWLKPTAEVQWSRKTSLSLFPCEA